MVAGWDAVQSLGQDDPSGKQVKWDSSVTDGMVGCHGSELFKEVSRAELGKTLFLNESGVRRWAGHQPGFSARIDTCIGGQPVLHTAGRRRCQVPLTGLAFLYGAGTLSGLPLSTTTKDKSKSTGKCQESTFNQCASNGDYFSPAGQLAG
ncbi:hypothetical protein UVI_02010210 [Ustilaginoidea virens]|uniref:Uncharacterized protein n=1 Tax=Ustilaginoidea virens TaxID=1159556 RepID=A0A1B5KWE3_USTVR|nr:hypothetical protein UVI_02010210 [Ustilaginoidea virens]